MQIRKLAALLSAMSVFVSSAAVLAAAPSAYDGQTYESLGYTSDDADGQVNLAVIASGDVTIGNSMHIEGSVYSAGNIYVHAGSGNQIHGLFISDTVNETQYSTESTYDSTKVDAEHNWGWITSTTYLDGYYLMNQYDDNLASDDVTYQTKLSTDTSAKGDFGTYPGGSYYAGAIYDKSTSFECKEDDVKYKIPKTTDYDDLKDIEMNVYGNESAGNLPVTITADTRIDTLSGNGYETNDNGYEAGLVIDTTAGDVNVVIDNFTMTNPSIIVKGENKANIYIKNVSSLKDLRVNYYNGEITGSYENTYLYLSSAEGSDVAINGGTVAVNTLSVDADSNAFTILGAAKITANDVKAETDSFVLSASSTVTATVCVPGADSQVIGSAVLYGQLHTKTLEINGWGSIIYKEDTAVAVMEATPVPTATVEPTAEPVASAEVTAAPVKPDLPSGGEISLSGVTYAYIFGDEPEITTNEDGSEDVSISMRPDDAVKTVEVCSMFMRLLDQEYDTKDATYTTDKVDMTKWYARGVAYLDSKGAFDGPVYETDATRGEVAKLLCYALNLSDMGEVSYSDTADSQYADYINIATTEGYMNGTSETTFEPDRAMTRSEFCCLINNITGRDDYDLETDDGTPVTAETYHIIDLAGNANADAMLRGTSAFNESGKVDLDMRNANIRNTLDNYDAQLKY